jgi:hypothetical protein
MDASLLLPAGRLPWRSLRIAIPMDLQRAAWNIRWPLYGRDLCRAITRHIARSLGLDPKKRTRVQGYTSCGYYFGYVLLYRGEPSEDDKKLFTRAKSMMHSVRSLELSRDPPHWQYR